MRTLSVAVILCWLATIVLSLVAGPDEGCTQSAVDVIGALSLGVAIGLSVTLAGGCLLKEKNK